MKCFECGSLCETVYHARTNMAHVSLSRVTHVSKKCKKCGWQSFKTKVPESI